jgi:hypothetical protein
VARTATRTVYLVGGFGLRNGETFQQWTGDAAASEVWALDVASLKWSIPFRVSTVFVSINTASKRNFDFFCPLSCLPGAAAWLVHCCRTAICT